MAKIDQKVQEMDHLITSQLPIVRKDNCESEIVMISFKVQDHFNINKYFQ